MSSQPLQIKLAGVSYPFEYRFSSFLAMEEKHKVNVFDASVFNDASPKLLTVLIWGGLILTHPELTAAKIGELLTIEEASEANRVVVSALLAAMPKPTVDVSTHDQSVGPA